jgi:hypothetical protein
MRLTIALWLRPVSSAKRANENHCLVTEFCIPRQPRRYNRRRYLSRLPYQRFRLRERRLLFHKIAGDTLEAMHRLGCPSHEWVRGHIFTHRFRLPELEGSVIAVLGRIASENDSLFKAHSLRRWL